MQTAIPCQLCDKRTVIRFCYCTPWDSASLDRRPTYSTESYIVLHCLTDKEQWEPTLEKLFDLSRGSSTFRIREAWAFDWQNHGDSAIMNEGIIQNDVAAARKRHVSFIPAGRCSDMHYIKHSLSGLLLSLRSYNLTLSADTALSVLGSPLER